MTRTTSEKRKTAPVREAPTASDTSRHLIAEVAGIIDKPIPAAARAARILALVGQSEHEFNEIFGESRSDPYTDKSVDATIAPRETGSVDIEKGLDDLLISSGVRSKGIRAKMKAALVPLIRRAKSRKDIAPSLEALAAVEFEERLQSMPLPEKAPKLYAEREDKSQDIIQFLRDPDGWWPWIEARVLCKSDIRQRDPQAYQALLNWLQHNEMPADMEIPTKQEMLERMVRNRVIPVSQARYVGRALQHQRAQAAKKPGA